MSSAGRPNRTRTPQPLPRQALAEIVKESIVTKRVGFGEPQKLAANYTATLVYRERRERNLSAFSFLSAFRRTTCACQTGVSRKSRFEIESQGSEVNPQGLERTPKSRYRTLGLSG